MKNFIEGYLDYVIYYENIFKGLSYFYLSLYGFFYYYINFGIYKIFILLWIYKNIIIIFFFNNLLKKKKICFMFKRRSMINLISIYNRDFLLKFLYYNFSKTLIFFFRF